MIYWLLKSVVLGPLLRLLFRPWIDGMHHVPEHGAAILASNHLSFSDSIFLPIVLPRRVTFPAKMEYFTGTGIKGWLVSGFMRSTGQIAIDRSGGDSANAAVEAGLGILRKGELFGIYPEGTRSPDGRLYKGKTGMARMALAARCPIIPVAMIDTDKAQPTGQIIPNILRVGLRFGEPLDFSRYYGMEDDHTALRAITDEVMYELARLSGQEYVDDYAAKRKAALTARAESLIADARGRADTLVSDARGRADEIISDAGAQSLAAATKARERAEALVAVARAAALERTERRAARTPGAEEPNPEDPDVP